jgi:predicted Zn-dependent peptidase
VQLIRTHQISNGLTLVAESMDWLESAAFTILVPAGCAYDPSPLPGLANFTCEMVQRGCGELSSREFSEALDRLGTDRSAGVTQAHTSFAAAMLAEKLPDALAIFADLLRRPHLPPDQMNEGRLVCLQELQALEDDLPQRTMQQLRLQTYGDPWGRSYLGTSAGIHSVAVSDLAGFHRQTYGPGGAVISVAGKLEWPALCSLIERLFGDWEPVTQPELTVHAATEHYCHITHDSQQTQIGIAFPTIPYAHPDYFRARGAVGVLSDGMSSRFFTEVRELRGLCYSIYASYHSLRDRARVLCYAGTSTERAQETLDVMLAELARLSAGIDEQELQRLKARVKSALVMQQEISTARSGAMAADWYHLERIRTMEETQREIDSLTVKSINAYLAENPPRDFTVVTLGAEPLEVSLEVS